MFPVPRQAGSSCTSLLWRYEVLFLPSEAAGRRNWNIFQLMLDTEQHPLLSFPFSLPSPGAHRACPMTQHWARAPPGPTGARAWRFAGSCRAGGGSRRCACQVRGRLRRVIPRLSSAAFVKASAGPLHFTRGIASNHLGWQRFNSC